MSSNFTCYKTYFSKTFSIFAVLIIERSNNRLPNGGKQKMMKMMEKEKNLIASLRYQIERYKSVGNGFMCQRLNAELQKLMTKQAAC